MKILIGWSKTFDKSCLPRKGKKTQGDQDQITQQHDRWFDNQKLFFRGFSYFFPPSNQTFLILMNFAYFSRRKFFSDLYPKNNFPWKILGVTWFKKTNVAIMPLLPQKLNWCNKWEVIFRHTFCSLEFCVIASFDLAISRWITLAARLTKTVIAQVSQLSFLGIWKRRVGPTWSLAIKLAGNQMRSHHDLQGVHSRLFTILGLKEISHLKFHR